LEKAWFLVWGTLEPSNGRTSQNKPKIIIKRRRKNGTAFSLPEFLEFKKWNLPMPNP